MFQKLISALFHFIHRSPGYRITPSSGESGDGPCNALINNLAGNRAIISHLFPEKGNWRRRASSGQAISAPCNYVLFFFIREILCRKTKEGDEPKHGEIEHSQQSRLAYCVKEDNRGGGRGRSRRVIIVLIRFAFPRWSVRRSFLLKVYEMSGKFERCYDYSRETGMFVELWRSWCEANI